MPKTHVSDEGTGICRAKSEATCPMTFNGEPSKHFENPEEAQAFYDEKMEELTSPVISKPSSQRSEEDISMRLETVSQQYKYLSSEDSRNLEEFTSKVQQRRRDIDDLFADKGKYLVDPYSYSTVGKIQDVYPGKSSHGRKSLSVSTDRGQKIYEWHPGEGESLIYTAEKKVEDVISEKRLKEMREKSNELLEVQKEMSSLLFKALEDS